MSFEVVGFEQGPLFRWSALLGAVAEFGSNTLKIGIIRDPYMINHKIVCARVEDFGIVFKPEEVDRLMRTVKKAQADFPKYARQVMETMEGAAHDARYANETARKAMI